MRETRDNNRLMRDLQKAMLIKQGRSFDKCEECGSTKGKMVMHHPKYVGATLQDLKIICQSCNTKARNRNLE